MKPSDTSSRPAQFQEQSAGFQEEPARFHEILAGFQEILGADGVRSGPEHLRAAGTATYDTHGDIPLILHPENAEQVRECVRLANRLRIALYPISSGRNWGYGSSVPPVPGCALLDLRRMARILDFDERLGYVTLEPGVTQRQLFRFLQTQNSRLWMDATGAGLDCSIIGNTLERGFGHTPYGDHFANACGLEVVLPSGEVLHTGFMSFADAKAGPAYRWGVGPVLDGLFSQSNFGIVTRMTIWLMPAPEYFQAYFFQTTAKAKLTSLIEALRPLRLDETIRSAIHIGNDYKVLAGIQQFPAGETTPLSREAIERHGRKLNFGRWNGSGALYGTKRQVKEARRRIRKALKGKVKRLQFLDQRMLSLATRFSRPYRLFTGLNLERTLELVRPVFGLMKGIPTDEFLGSCYWRKPGQPPRQGANPDRDRCGLIWFAPVAPAKGEAVDELVNISEEILLRHGFEPGISLTMITGRAVACVMSIAYDRDVPGEDEKAMRCYRELLDASMRKGYYSYRLGIQAMESLRARPAFNDFVSTLKKSIDPNNILSPGRYLPAITPEAALPHRSHRFTDELASEFPRVAE